MALQCSICAHPRREEIDRALLEGRLSNRKVAAQFGVTESSIRRHLKGGHIADNLIKAQEKHEAASADRLLGFIEGLLAECLRTIKDARGDATRRPDDATKLKAIREARETAKVLLQAQERLPGDGAAVNVTVVENQWNDFRAVVLSTLCPECRATVISKLQERKRQREDTS